MVKKMLSWANFCVAGLAVFLLILAGGLVLTRPAEIPIPKVTPKKSVLPEGAFTMSKEAYEAIGQPLLKLEYVPMTLRLPDLRRYLVYYGKNARPDADPELSLLHFTFTGKNEISSIKPGEPLYLLYDKNQPRSKYIFSPDNQETSLWIEASSKEKDTIVKVFIKNDQSEIIRHPKDHAEFSLKQKEFARIGGTKWEIGKWRVDGTLLARQRARWYGYDKFLERHGGEEFSEFQDKQRIDFVEGEEAYSVYVGPNDALIWDGQRWVQIEPSEASKEFPMLVVNKVDERLMRLDLWDVDGRAKVSLNLLKSSEKWIPAHIQRTFKFVGARTRSQFVFEVDDDRMLISPHDWLILTEDGWKKMNTVQEIDDYVDRKMTGPLFVFDGVVRKEGKQILVGTIFNATRTDMKTIELPVQQGQAKFTPVARKKQLKEQLKKQLESMVKFKENDRKKQEK